MSEARAGAERFREGLLRDDSDERWKDTGRRGALAIGLILLATCVALFLTWQTVSSLLIVFAGVLFAAFLDASARALAPVLPVNRAWRLTFVLLLLFALTGF